MRSLHVVASFLVLLSFQSYSQQLIINEVSQGTAGSAEYVELLVIGTPSCQTPTPCLDLRGIVLDDNNSYFGAGGIASGAIRFANNAFWSCIPQGTLIVIYNDSDRNSAIPPDDLTMSDGNCRLIIPVNSNLIEGQSISPNSSGNSSYPANSSWIVGAGNWNSVSMNNSNDSFLILSSITATIPSHAVSYGNNLNNSIIYFSGAAGGKVFSMTNNTNNNPATQANWTSGTAGINETPGAANNTANSAWIGSMNPQCGVTTSVQVTASATSTGCGSTCTGTANTTVTGGTAPYTYSWSNGANTANITALCAGTYTVTVTDNGGCSMTAQATVTNGASALTVTLTSANESCVGTCDGGLTGSTSGGTGPYNYLWSDNTTFANISNKCPGTYSVTVTDQNGCTGTASGTISAGTPVQDATIQTTGPFSTTDSPVQFVAASAGGTWSSNCGTCISASGLFNPQTAGAGTYQICYSVGAGACASQDCQTIVVTGCTPQTTNESHSICPGDTYTFNGQNFSTAGAYPIVFTGQNGCDSTHTLNLSLFTVNPTTQNLINCIGDSVEVQGTWYFQPDNVVTNIQDGNGCPTTHTVQILFEDCSVEDYAVFIPNVFTPNSDNVNDFFSISIMGGFLAEGFIVNRWGNLIKEFHVDDLKWDGKTNLGLPVPDGVYTYVFVVTNNNGVNTKYQGFVTVIR
jgi:gliding motility-associated-like protein